MTSSDDLQRRPSSRVSSKSISLHTWRNMLTANIIVPRMADYVHVVVLANNSCWDMLLVTPNVTISYNKAVSPWKFEYCCDGREPSKISALSCSQNFFLNNHSEEFIDLECIKRRLKRLRINKSSSFIPQLKFKSEGLHFSVFLKELRNSDIYRLLVLQQWILRFKMKYPQNIATEHDHVVIQWTLKDTIPCIIDFDWCIRMNRCTQERQHLDTAMSWLSTLGGACSALGDYDSQFAERAGKISVQQMDIAFRLGDPSIVSRCRLYAAISLIQQCKFKLAAAVIKSEYYWVIAIPKEVRDQRLVNMCHGIWTKLRHEHKLYRITRQGISTGKNYGSPQNI